MHGSVVAQSAQLIAPEGPRSESLVDGSFNTMTLPNLEAQSYHYSYAAVQRSPYLGSTFFFFFSRAYCPKP